MEYKNLKDIASKAGRVASIAIVASLPYVCESCGYNGNKADAATIGNPNPIIQCHPRDPNNLEAVLDLR